MPNNYKTPNVISIPDPKGLDLAIYQLQTKFTYLTWLTYSFGRAWVMNDFEGEGTRRTTTSDGIKPKVFAGPLSNKKDGNYLDALPNDNWNSYSFFVAEGQETPTGNDEWQSVGRNIFTRPMSVIFWLRVDKTHPSYRHIPLEEIKTEVYAKFKLIPKVKVTGYTDETEEVWSGFDWTNNQNKNLRYPNMGFRIFFDLTYNESC